MFPLRDTIPSRCVPLMTWALIAANTAVFVFQTLLPQEALERFVYVFGMVPARFTQPAWARWVGLRPSLWPFLTHMFLHGNLPHLIGNMWTLWIFGDNVEDRMGHLRFLLFYVLSGLAAAVAQFWFSAGSRIPMVGASGAIAGVLGAYFIMFPRSRVITMLPIFFYPVFYELPAVTYLFIWFLTQLWAGTVQGLSGVSTMGGVAWWAHVGGFVFGVLFHRLFVSSRRCVRRRWQRDEYGIEGAWRPWI